MSVEDFYPEKEKAFRAGGGILEPPVMLAERKQDARLWSPADMVGAVARELQQEGAYGGKKITKAAIILYSEDSDRQVVIVQAGCSMLELQGLLRFAEQTVDKAVIG